MNIKALSGADLARCFGVDRSMVTRWKKAGMPEEKGVFSLPLCIKWRIEREADAMAPKSSASTEGEKWLTAFRRERARTARLERLKIQGDLFPRAELVPEWIEVFMEFRQACLALENRLPPLLDGKNADDMSAVIHSQVKPMLDALARPGKYRCDPTKNLKEKFEEKENNK